MNKKKMKKFWDKYKLPVIVVVLLVLFVLLSTLIGDKVERDEVDDWLEETKKEQYVVTLLSQTTCGYCAEFKPIVNEVVSEYGDQFMYKVFEIDTIVKPQVKNKLLSSYDLENNGFTGTPHLFVTYNGEHLGQFNMPRTKENVISFLRDLGAIK